MAYNLYVNGSLFDSRSADVYNNITQGPTIIGNDNEWWGPYEGMLDEFFIYSRALSAQEVSAMYAGMSISNDFVSGWPWTIIADGARVNILEAIYDTDPESPTYTTFQTMNGGSFGDTDTTTPDVPTSITATAGNAQATVSFTAPTNNGGSSITGYTVTSSPGGITGTGASSPIIVAGLTNGTTYTFTVTATNAVGIGSASSASNSVTLISIASVILYGGGGGGYSATPATPATPPQTSATPATPATNQFEQILADATAIFTGTGITKNPALETSAAGKYTAKIVVGVSNVAASVKDAITSFIANGTISGI